MIPTEMPKNINDFIPPKQQEQILALLTEFDSRLAEIMEGRQAFVVLFYHAFLGVVPFSNCAKDDDLPELLECLAAWLRPHKSKEPA